MFYNAAAKRGVEILLGRLVRAVDESRPAVMFEDGSNVEADLVIGGDGASLGTTHSIPR
jgi:2-polyprenyl-6-methoxyphenol hydroxylase-like FAD-dependent oxidoreductase